MYEECEYECGVSRLDGVANEEIRRGMGIDKRVTEEAEKTRLKWYGYVKKWTITDVPGKYYNQPHKKEQEDPQQIA